MRFGRYLTTLTMPELEQLAMELNLTDEESEIFNQLSKGKSNVEVAYNCGIATSTLSYKIKNITNKCNKLKRGCD